MTVAIVTAWHGRPELTRFVADYYAQNHAGPLIAACTEEELDRIGKVDGWINTLVPENVVSDKFNAACDMAGALDVDAVCIIGSDDLLCRNYMDAATELVAMNDYVVANGLYFYDTIRKRSIYLNTSAPPGCGRFLSARLMTALNWQPYAAGLDKCIEASMASRLAEVSETRFSRCTINVDPGEDMYIVDLKSDDNIWPYDRWLHTPTTRHVSNDYLARFGIAVESTIPYVAPLSVEDYRLSVTDDRATIRLEFSVDHEISQNSLPDIVRLLADKLSYPVELGPLVSRDHAGNIVR